MAFQLYYALRIMQDFCKDEPEYVAWLKAEADKLLGIINDTCFEEDRFIRGYTEAGQIIGSKKDREAAMWLNPQSWAVISGGATPEQAEIIMETAHEKLNTPYGLEVMAPAYRFEAFDGARMILFNPGTKENGGIFCQIQGWAILAEALLGHGNRAFQYFAESSPASFNEDADRRVIEPYVHGQFIEGHDSPFAGRSHVHWLTGTASTVMVGCVEGILGLRPTPEGILVKPAIPAEWDGFTMEKKFRGKTLKITVDNAAHKAGKSCPLHPERSGAARGGHPGGGAAGRKRADRGDVKTVFPDGKAGGREKQKTVLSAGEGSSGRGDFFREESMEMKAIAHGSKTPIPANSGCPGRAAWWRK